MEKYEIVLLNTLAKTIRSGGNIYNDQLEHYYKQWGAHDFQYKHCKELLFDVKTTKKNQILLIDSICINEPIDWTLLVDFKVIILIHMVPTQNIERSTSKFEDIKKIEKWFFKQFPIISAGHYAIDYIRSTHGLIPKEVGILPPGLDSQWQKKKSFNRVAKQIIVVANVIPAKGFFRLIECLSQIEATNWTCTIYGDTSDENFFNLLLDKVGEKGLEEFISFEGSVAHLEINQKMIDADLLLHLSDFENNSLAINEAIATGLPFVTTPCGNYKYYMNIDSGHVTTSFDSNKIAREIEQYFVSEEAYKRLINSMRHVESNSWKKNIDELDKFISELWP